MVLNPINPKTMGLIGSSKSFRKASSRSLSLTLLPLFYFRAPLLKPNSRKKGTLIIKRLVRNQVILPEGPGS